MTQMTKYMFLLWLWLPLAVSCQKGVTPTSGGDPVKYVTAKTANAKAVEFYKEGRSLLFRGDNGRALGEFDKALKKEPYFIDAMLLKAEALAVMEQNDNAREWYAKVCALDSAYAPKIYYTQGRMAYSEKNYDLAAKNMNIFLGYYKEADELSYKARRIKENALFIPKAMANPLPFNPVNLGPGINTELEEYVPAITADESLLYFTRRLKDGMRDNEDFFVSEKGPDGTWQPAKNLGAPVNSRENEGCESISADNRTIIYAMCGDYTEFGGCDLYISDVINGKWSKPVNMGPSINTNQWESQPAVSANGDQLIFVRGTHSRSDDHDLWIAKRKPDGSWEQAKRLDDLNSQGNEETPFWHADGQTLYFSSTGYEGLGGFDMFLSRKGADGSWGKPQNLGYPINSDKDDLGIVVQLDGKVALISSRREGGFGTTDIWSFEVPEVNRPSAATFVKAIVKDAVTKELIPGAAAEITDIANNGQLFARKGTDKSGSFLICIAGGKTWGLSVSKKGYLFYSDNFDLAPDGTRTADKPFVLEIFLQPIGTSAPGTPTAAPTESAPIILKNIFFATASAELKTASYAELNKLMKLLEENPTMKIQINGHTDNVGADADNMTLSDRRAKAVVNFLTRNGISESRLSSKGFGETMPIDTNDTPLGRQNNRRTEFVIKG